MFNVRLSPEGATGRTLKVLEDFRGIRQALERISVSLSAAARNHEEREPLLHRLNELERTRGLWEAQVEGLLAKAEGKLKAAANAEARERTMQKRYEADFDPFGPHGEEEGPAVPEDDAEVGYPEEVQPVHLGVEAESPRQLRLRYKFG